jgi:hypothetical protein
MGRRATVDMGKAEKLKAEPETDEVKAEMAGREVEA